MPWTDLSMEKQDDPAALGRNWDRWSGVVPSEETEAGTLVRLQRLGCHRQKFPIWKFDFVAIENVFETFKITLPISSSKHSCRGHSKMSNYRHRVLQKVVHLRNTETFRCNYWMFCRSRFTFLCRRRRRSDRRCSRHSSRFLTRNDSAESQRRC